MNMNTILKKDQIVTFHIIKPSHTHHNINTIGDLIKSCREYILHDKIRLLVYEGDPSFNSKEVATIKAICEFDLHDKSNFIKSGCGVAAHIRNWITRNYAIDNALVFEILPFNCY